MKDFALFDDTFNITASSTYHISVQLSQYAYSYAILDTFRNKYVALKHQNFADKQSAAGFAQQVETAFKADAYLTKNYKAVAFILISDKSTVVPEAIFDKKQAGKFLGFTIPLDANDEVHFNRVANVGAYSVFSMPSDVTTMLINMFPGVTFYHQSAAFINQSIAFVKSSARQGKLVRVNVERDFIDVLVTQGDKLLLANSFKYMSDTDFAYYVMNVYKQLQLDGKVDELQLSGYIADGDDNYKRLKRYIEYVRFTEAEPSLNYSLAFDKTPLHPFTNLLHVVKCA